MALNSSPRKTVPLATGDEPRAPEPHQPTVTKRVFYCGVVVEGSEHGRRLPDEIQDLVLSLGNPLPSEEENMLSNRPESNLNSDSVTQRKRSLTDTSALTAVINELVTSERSYVRRLQILKNDYADPLRNFARSKETAIIPPYEAKTLFGNIDNLLPVNEAFLTDLEKMLAPNGANLVGGVGDVALKHFKDQRGFEQYKQFYVKREDAQQIFEREASKRSSRFGSYIDHIKYQSTDPKNRVGLRELLMEPVQRIPRYTLLFREMLKHMGPEDPQRAKVTEADAIASKIAQAETDEQTKRAAIFYCLSATIDGFPPDLFSNSRKFIDCIDVEDVIGELPSSSAASSTGGSPTVLHCTLFLFDDKLLIVKRPNGDRGGRALSGLDILDKLTKSGGIPTGKKKSGMSSKGVVDLADVVVSDPGGADINMYLESPPPDQSDRWSSRPFRSLVVVNPPMASNLDPTQTESEKHRFLENLWQVQATYRSRAGQSVVLCSEEHEAENRTNRTVFARTFYNVYTRTAFLQEPKKTKVVVHIDPMGSADPIPFGMEAAPYVRIRVQPIAGGLCRFSVSSSDPRDDSEEDIVQLERVPSRIVHTIHQYGLFQFRTGKNSMPGTPTARSKASIFGLDTISRNLFNSRPGSAMGDFFGGTITSHRRTKSATSRSSIYTQTTATGDSFLKSHRSSNSTTATTVTMDDDASIFSSRSFKGKSAGRMDGGPSPGSNIGSLGNRLTSQSLTSLSNSLSKSSRHQLHERQYQSDYSDVEDDDKATIGTTFKNDSSDYKLALRLELARQNSLNQHGKPLPPIAKDMPVEETIYEEGPPHPLRMASLDGSQFLPRPSSPFRRAESPPELRSSRHSEDKRPMGPRPPSPLPPQKSPSTRSLVLDPLSTDHEDSDNDTGDTSDYDQPPVRNSRASGIPRSRRQPVHLNPVANVDAKPRGSTSSASAAATLSIEPLSIKKKTSTRATDSHVFPPSPTPRRSFVKNSPLSRVARTGFPRKVSPQFKRLKALSTGHPVKCEVVDDLIKTAAMTRDDIESSHRAVKRIRLEVEKIAGFSASQSGSEESYSRPSSPDKALRAGPTPSHSQPLTKEAQQRLDEMRNMINRRQGDSTPRRIRGGIFDDTPKARDRSGSLDHLSGRIYPLAGNVDQQVTRSLSSLATDAEEGLAKAAKSHEGLQKDLKDMATQFREKLIELERMRLELQNAKRQTELVKSLLADATAEKDIMYEAFNEELDGMFNDVNLPDDEAWAALSKDLRETKESRNELNKNNSQLGRRLAETESQRDEWGALLRSHGLIP